MTSCVDDKRQPMGSPLLAVYSIKLETLELNTVFAVWSDGRILFSNGDMLSSGVLPAEDVANIGNALIQVPDAKHRAYIEPHAERLLVVDAQSLATHVRIVGSESLSYMKGLVQYRLGQGWNKESISGLQQIVATLDRVLPLVRFEHIQDISAFRGEVQREGMFADYGRLTRGEFTSQKTTNNLPR